MIGNKLHTVCLKEAYVLKCGTNRKLNKASKKTIAFIDGLQHHMYMIVYIYIYIYLILTVSSMFFVTYILLSVFSTLHVYKPESDFVSCPSDIHKCIQLR